MVWGMDSQYFSGYEHSVILATFVEKIHSPLNWLCNFVKNYLYIHRWIYSWVLYFVLLMYSSIFAPVTHCGFVSLKWGSVNPPNFFFFLEVILAILGDLHFHINFKIRFFCRQNCRDFDWVCIEFKDPFVENWHR